ncbi:unnamed protein product [Polarella glacialis]|uniref:50S ribosomal protein L3, chloroplastic n=1 Tax=Polarella glacialis TaxID=89957 RepID=A0A813IFM6_POLGL|nr:unnamed protein product [Polarella glacialis]
MGFKAGMTHIVRDVDKPGSKLHKKEVVEPVTILEAPPMVVVGFVGYVETPRGLRALTSVWAGHLSEECKRRFYKSFHSSKQKAFTKYQKRWSEASKGSETPMAAEVERAKKYCQVIRAICHTQVGKVSIGQKKAHIKEIQVNGGSTEKKVDFAMGLFEQEVKVADIFSQDEMIDIIGATKGHGFEGVVTRWGVTRLARNLVLLEIFSILFGRCWFGGCLLFFWFVCCLVVLWLFVVVCSVVMLHDTLSTCKASHTAGSERLATGNLK